MSVSKKLVYADQVRRAVLRECPSAAYVVDNVPAVEAKPVVRATWIYVDGKGSNAEYECNNCHKHVCFDEQIDGTIPMYSFCPHCGATVEATALNGDNQ